jgi:hypothetical protein
MDLSKMIVPHELFIYDFEQKNSKGEPYSHSERIRIYETLIKNSSNAGLMTSAIEWDKDYKRYMYRYNNRYVGPAWTWINDCWWDFGYGKWRIFWIWMPLFFLIFTLLNIIFLPRLLDVYYDDEIGNTFKMEHTSKAVLVRRYRFSYSVVYTAAIYFNFKLSFAGMNFKRPWWNLYILLIYSIGTIHVIFGVVGYILND